MTTVTYTTPGTYSGSGSGWLCPAGVTSVLAECWGGGGAGGGASSSTEGGGGAGAEYAAEATLAVTAGLYYTFTVGAAGTGGTGTGGTGGTSSFAGDSVTVTAHAGTGGTSAATGLGGTGGTGSTNSTHYNGGAGGSGNSSSGNSGGGGGSGGTGSAGNTGGSASSGAAGSGATAVTGGGPGQAGKLQSSGGNGNAPGSGPGGGGGGAPGTNSGTATGGNGYAGQVRLTYTASGTLHSGTASLSGSGTLGGSGVFAGSSSLSGSGTLTGTGTSAGFGGGATLAGIGALSGAGTGLRVQAGALSGAGTLAATWIGLMQQPPATLSGLGTLGLSGVRLGYPAAMAGNGTLSVLQATGGTVFASPGAATPQAYPCSSQVAVAPPGSSNWQYLGTLGHVTALTYSYVCPGGADKMSCTVMVPAAYRTSLFNPGWQVRITRGGHQVWSGRLDEPVPTPSGWTLSAIGAGNRGQDFLAIYSDPWPNSEPDESINNAITRGLPWVNPGVGQPSGAWFGQSVDSGAQTVTALLNLVCTRGGLTWYVNSQPGGWYGDDLRVVPLPTVPNRLLMATSPVPRTLGGDINTIWIRYEATADNSSSGGTAATYAVTSAVNAASVAAHGVIETFIDLSDVGVQSAGSAQSVGAAVLQIYQRASFAGPFTAHYGQLMTTGGVPIDPGTDQAGTMVRLILADYGYGGEVAPGGPVEFITGAYEWDDLAQVATITPYQALDQSLSGLLSMDNTVLQPITVASGP